MKVNGQLVVNFAELGIGIFTAIWNALHAQTPIITAADAKQAASIATEHTHAALDTISTSGK